MVIADLAEPLEVTDRRREHADGTGDRLDDHGRDVAAVVELGEAFEIVGEVRAPFR